MEVRQNPLGSAPLGKLLVKFAVPSIISMLVSALYNIVDQIFIGQGVGMYGNAATNVAFPLTTLATAVGVIICIVARIFLRPLITVFGATEYVMDYAMTYVGITSLGMPFFVLTTGGTHLIRADGKPTYSMLSALAGAVINTILDPLFIFVFKWGIAGAACSDIYQSFTP